MFDVGVKVLHLSNVPGFVIVLIEHDNIIFNFYQAWGH